MVVVVVMCRWRETACDVRVLRCVDYSGGVLCYPLAKLKKLRQKRVTHTHATLTHTRSPSRRGVTPSDFFSGDFVAELKYFYHFCRSPLRPKVSKRKNFRRLSLPPLPSANHQHSRLSAHTHKHSRTLFNDNAHTPATLRVFLFCFSCQRRSRRRLHHFPRESP